MALFPQGVVYQTCTKSEEKINEPTSVPRRCLEETVILEGWACPFQPHCKKMVSSGHGVAGEASLSQCKKPRSPILSPSLLNNGLDFWVYTPVS